MNALLHLSPAARVALAGTVVLIVAGALPGDLQARHHRALGAAVLVGVGLVAAGAALLLGGGA